MELDEQTTNLIREYVYVNVFVEGLKNEALPFLKEARIALRDWIVMVTKYCGQEYTRRLREIGAELRRDGIALWVEDQGETFYAHVNQRGSKEIFGIKRKVINEEIEKMFNKYMERIEKAISGEYKPQMMRMEG